MSSEAPRLLVATRNRGKLRELTSLLSGCPFPLVSLDDAGIDEDVAETGSTLEENATLKAEAYARLSRMPTLADDSGLEVEALDGEPGPLSARYAGEGASDQERIAFLVEKLTASGREPPWGARFRCALAIAWQSEPVEVVIGDCQGVIIEEPRGSNGFGYDPIFLLPELGRTMAELSSERKNRISHRARAAQAVVATLKRRSEDADGSPHRHSRA